jgi:hypothetical protein
VPVGLAPPGPWVLPGRAETRCIAQMPCRLRDRRALLRAPWKKPRRSRDARYRRLGRGSRGHVQCGLPSRDYPISYARNFRRFPRTNPVANLSDKSP